MTEETENKTRISTHHYQALVGFVKAAQSAVKAVEFYRKEFEQLLKSLVRKDYPTDWISDVIWDTNVDVDTALRGEFEPV